MDEQHSREPEIPPGEFRKHLPIAATLFYGAALALVVGLSFAFGDGVSVRLDEPLFPPGLAIVIGVAAGAALAGLSWAASRVIPIYHEMVEDLHAKLRPVDEVLVLTVSGVAGVAEEIIFRGVFLPWLGLLGSTLLFGLAHYPPRGKYWVWTAFALAAGLLFGWLFQWTGWLFAPIAAHATVNAVSLLVLAHRDEKKSPGNSPEV
ncbi:MAG: hypothetical protein GMKNLPBB_02138 [Myxococcota bacterium]|nr:hypothetical protein [Myxococcota bacterium]